MNILEQIEVGAILVVSYGVWWPEKYGKVLESKSDKYGNHLIVQVLGENSLPIPVQHVGPADMKSIGWRIASESDIQRMNRYLEYQEQQPEELSDELNRRTMEAKQETVKLLNKAESYSPDFRKPEQIRFYKAHIEYLDSLLAGKPADKPKADPAKWDRMQVVIDAELAAV